MHAAVDGLMLEYRRAALFYGAGCGRLAFCPFHGPCGRGVATEGWFMAAWRGGGRMSMFFLSLMLFAWLVFDWHAAVPMMIAMCFAAYGAPLPWHADSAPVAQCPHPSRARNTCNGPALTHRRSLERRHVPLRAATDPQV